MCRRMIASFIRAPHARPRPPEHARALKPAEIDIRSLAPRVRTALEAVSALGSSEHAQQSIELLAALAQLQADDEVLLAGLLVPVLHGGLVDEAKSVQMGRQLGAQYMLYGNFSSIVKTAGNTKDVYYKFTMKLTDIESGLVEFQSEKEIRKTKKKSLMGG